MEIKLTPEESEEYFLNALCNAVGNGYMASYGLDFDFESREDYVSAKQHLKDNKKECSYEDVMIQALRQGANLVCTDLEGDGEYNKKISLKDVHERVQKTDARHLMDMINENDDAVTADVIIQTVFFEEIIFG